MIDGYKYVDFLGETYVLTPVGYNEDMRMCPTCESCALSPYCGETTGCEHADLPDVHGTCGVLENRNYQPLERY